jgi:outer membrane protein assembly factor BamB
MSTGFKRKVRISVAFAAMGVGGLMTYHAVAGDSKATQDWPQWRGPNRDGVVANSPKLLDSWPKEGPPLVWRSEWIPSQFNGNESSPVVADGKVFLFVAWRQPVGGGSKVKIITAEFLVDAGWLPDLPDELAKKVEEARTSKDKPRPHGNYIDQLDDEYTKAMEDAFLAKETDMDKYIKDFIAKLDTKDAVKYGAYVRRRLSMTSGPDTQFGPPALTWDDLVKLSKIRDAEFEAYAESRNKVRETLGHDVGYGGSSQFLMRAWRRAAPRADTVICLDAATGKMLWKKRFTPEDHELLLKEHSISGKTSDYAGVGVCATPAVWNGKCYVQGACGLYCLSAKDGSVTWQAKDAKITHGSPLVADGVVFQYDRAYNAETGAVLWETERGKSWAWRDCANFSSVLWTANGKKYIIGQNNPDKTWACMELETGKVLWTLDKSGVSHLDLLSPVIQDNILVQCVSCRGKKMVRAFKH